MKELYAHWVKMPDLASILQEFADKYLEIVVKTLVLASSLWASLASLIYLSQVTAA